MKVKLPPGTSIAQIYRFFSKTRAKRLLYFTSVCLYLTGFCWYGTNAQAQRSEVPKQIGKTNNIKPTKPTDSLGIPEGGLKIGDPIPEALWHLPLQVVNHPEGKDTITLNDYRGKLIILDFWATWCGGCVEAMPKIHAYKQPFGESIAVLASTYEPAEKAGNFLNNNKTVKDLKVTSLVNNMLFTEIFAHKLIPHYVWINAAGTIETTTSTDQVTDTNMAAVIHNEKKAIPSKKDADMSKPLFLDSSLFDQNRLIHHSLLIEGWNNGVPPGPKVQRNQQGDSTGFSLTNKRLLHLYEYCTRQLFRLNGLSYSGKKLVIETVDTLSLTDSYFSFSLTAPGFGTPSFFRQMLATLNLYSGYVGTIEKRETACYILKRNSGPINFKSVGEEKVNTLLRDGKTGKGRLTGYPISRLVNVINNTVLRDSETFLVDETGYDGLVNIIISLETNNLDTLNEQLKVYHLKVSKGVTSTEMLVIRSADHKSKSSFLTLN